MNIWRGLMTQRILTVRKHLSLTLQWVYETQNVVATNLFGTGFFLWYVVPKLRPGWYRDLIRVEERFSVPIQIGPGPHPTSCDTGYLVSFSGVKRPECGLGHPSPPSAEVKERVQLYLYSPSRPSWPVLGWNIPLPAVQ